MKNYKFSDLIVYEKRIKKLFSSVGVSVSSSSRIYQYFSYLKALDEARTKSSQDFHDFLETDKVKYYYSQFYVLEIKSIVEAIEQTKQDLNLLRIKMKDFANGSYLLSEENQKDTSARNITFELSLFAFLHSMGIKAKLGEPNPDLQVSTSQFTYNIECKRPCSIKSFEKNIRKAWKQLNKPSTPYGIPTIAISLDKVLINDDLIYHSLSEQATLEGLDILLSEFMLKTQHVIDKIIHSNSCVILYYISCLSGFESKNIPMANATYMIGNVCNFENKDIYKDLNSFSGMRLRV